MKNLPFRIGAIICLLSLIFGSFHLSLYSQVRPIYSRGAAGLGKALKRLQTTASAMHTAAHPDDEDSGLLAYLSLREAARTSYLSLTRGDGGQNVIGPELSENLGIIRSEELLQGRRLDGGEQYFTRAMDYGFSKSLAESRRIWDEKEVLRDMVFAIRKFRPLVIISRFSGTPADGHGHHQMAGYLTPMAFKAAADPKEFPEQLEIGLQPWQAKKFYVSQSFSQNAANAPTLTLNTGEYDPLLGRSFFEIAMEGRSQHKSQEMGVPELRGRQTSGMRLVESFTPKLDKETSIFDGIDTSIKGIAALTDNSEGPFIAKLAELQAAAENALDAYRPFSPQELIPILANGIKISREAKRLTKNNASLFMIDQKESEFSEALRMAAGITMDALSDAETIVPGDGANIAVRIFAEENSPIKINNVRLITPAGWISEAAKEPAAPQAGFRSRRENAFGASYFNLKSPFDFALTQPYWLEDPRDKFLFSWRGPNRKTTPFQEPLIKALAKIEVGGEEITIEKPVEYRYADDIRGEIRRNINVVPAVSVSLDSNLMIAPVSDKAEKHKVVVSVVNHSAKPQKGTVRLILPNGSFVEIRPLKGDDWRKEIKGWKAVPESADFELAARGNKKTIEFELSIPAGSYPSDYKIGAEAIIDGKTFDQAMQILAYPHIQTHRRYTKAEISAKVFPLKVLPVNIGYVMGSGDSVPEAIKRLGLEAKMLGEGDLSSGDLSKFDTIILGIRASQVRPDLIANNSRLLDYVKNGGCLIVQYQQNDYLSNNLAPFPAKMSARVTDEDAPVKILAPEHPVFNVPNKIIDEDWRNWVQERNLYAFTEFDANYKPLLESHDAGEAENNGGMLYAEIGKGKYLYTSYSWFRQLPAGVPGAYRMLANMLALGAKKKPLSKARGR